MIPKHQLLVTAINTSQILEFVYDRVYHVVEPHIYGINALGNEVLIGFQTAGGSESGTSTGWGQFVVENLKNLKVTSLHFSGARPGHVRNLAQMQLIFAQV